MNDPFEPSDLMPWQEMSRRIEDLCIAHGLDVVVMREQTRRIEELMQKLDQVEIRLKDLEKTGGEMMPANDAAFMPVEEENGNSSFEDYENRQELRAQERFNTRFGNLPEQKIEIEEDIWEGSEWI